MGGGLGGTRLEAQGRSARESGALAKARPGSGGAPSRMALDRRTCGARQERIRRLPRHPRGAASGALQRLRSRSGAARASIMSVYKDGVAGNTHFLNVLPDGAAAPAVDRIPL